MCTYFFIIIIIIFFVFVQYYLSLFAYTFFLLLVYRPPYNIRLFIMYYAYILLLEIYKTKQKKKTYTTVAPLNIRCSLKRTPGVLLLSYWNHSLLTRRLIFRLLLRSKNSSHRRRRRQLIVAIFRRRVPRQRFNENLTRKFKHTV